MDKLFGANWITSLLGYVAGASISASELIQQGGLPHDLHGWLVFLSGIVLAMLGRAAKDGNKSNAPSPVATPNPVP